MENLTRKKAVVAWHWLTEDRRTQFDHAGRGRIKVRAGRKLVHRGDVVLCQSGLHASERALDSLKYAPGSIICRVACWGTVVRGDDKLACSERAVLWMADATRVLHAFACDVAADALEAGRRSGREPDARSLAAIATKRLWLDGKATHDDRSAAGSAAWSAAWSAAGSVAESAARSAARSAAGAAAWSAAESDAWSDAWSAAWSDAESAHNTRLTAALEALKPAGAR